MLAFATKKGFVDEEHGNLFSVGNVKAKAARPVWSFLYKATGTSSPSWNFKGKYLVDRTGKVRVPSNLEAEIKEMLAAGAPTAEAEAEVEEEVGGGSSKGANL